MNEHDEKFRKLARKVAELIAQGKAREERRRQKEERFRNALGIRLRTSPGPQKEQ